jgi:hypothetical protein
MLANIDLLKVQKLNIKKKKLMKNKIMPLFHPRKLKENIPKLQSSLNKVQE